MLNKSIAGFLPLGVVCCLAIISPTPALAAANGLPHLDPTNNQQGTVYTVTLVGSYRSMDPAFMDGSFTYRGSMTVFQDSGVNDFSADMELDITGDGLVDRTLNCPGVVGNGRVGMRCSGNDGLGEFRFTVTGLAKVLDSGKLGMRKVAGRGYTESRTLSFGFAATQQ